jgi:uncharacterized protein
MKILVDADACPKLIKEIIFKAANKRKIETILFANHAVHVPLSKFIKFKLVPKGFDVADSEIEAMVSSGDLVVTADIPLADSVITKQAHAINVRGQVYTKDNIKDILATRNLMQDLKDAGTVSGGPKALSNKDTQAFANALDRYLSKPSNK